MVALKEQDYDKYARKMKKYLKWELIILDDFLLHTITDEREIKILFELLEKRNEQRSTIVCSQRDPASWKAMIINETVFLATPSRITIDLFLKRFIIPLAHSFFL